MAAKYDYKAIEQKWRKNWEASPVNKPDKGKPKYYCLDMFPYPSASGLHVGHWRGYVISDCLSRHKILEGYEVLHPMGFDSFGLPAENYAISQGIHPAIATAKNEENFRRQLKELSAVYDWDREFSTTDPDYYKWTQWIFVKMFKAGLAYEKEMPLNWCPSCKTVLANEEAVGGECDRCHSTVTKKMLRQWMLGITKYAERLLLDLDKLQWPERVKKMQAEWIGKSFGAEIDFLVEGSDKAVKVFTTRPDTLFGATFMVLAPGHKLVSELTTNECKKEMDKYVFLASTKSAVDRLASKEKTGVFTGSYAINPLSGEKAPIWVSDYVLEDYGTGAIMCVPGHDERDFEFATKFSLPILQVIKKADAPDNEPLTEAYTGTGAMINSGKWNGIPSSEALELIANHLEAEGIGKKTVNYKLRDWVFSRQRYWGEPIPIIHCKGCGAVAVPEKDLPVILPDVESYQPTDTGESPLADIPEFVNTTCPTCGAPAKRETNTMPQWAGSSWYFLRYPDNKNNGELASKEALNTWLPVDMYIGGVEHAVLHLLYARFYTKFLYDIGAVEFNEPFMRLFNQGMVTYTDPKTGIKGKMSKSQGNFVSPDDMVEHYGCDALRMYILFAGPPEQDCEWDDSGIDGTFRYLNRCWRFVSEYKDKIIEPNKDFDFLRNKFIYEITNRLNNFTLNTVVSGFMEYTTKMAELAGKSGGIDSASLDTLIVMLSPFAPHIAEEMWQERGNASSVFTCSWPKYDSDKLVEDTVEIAVQINGKLRGSIKVSADEPKEVVIETAKKELATRLDGVEIVKEIYVPKKIVNFVVKA